MSHTIITTLVNVVQATIDRGNAAPSKAVQRKAARLLGVPSQGFRPDLARIVYVAGDTREYPVALYVGRDPSHSDELHTIVGAECPCDHYGRLADEGDMTPHAMCSHVLTALTLAASQGYQIKTKEKN